MLRFLALATVSVSSVALSTPVPNVHCTNQAEQIEFYVNYLPSGRVLGSVLTLGNQSVTMRCAPLEEGFTCAETRAGDGRFLVAVSGRQGRVLLEQVFPLPPIHIANLQCGSRM